VILKIAYGYTIESNKSDPLVDLADEAMDQFSLGSRPGYWLVDIMSFCEYYEHYLFLQCANGNSKVKYLPEGLPGMSFKRTARHWKQTLVDLVERPYMFVVQQMQTAGHKYEPSYLSKLLEPGTVNLSPEELFVAKWSAVSLYGGGADTVRPRKSRLRALQRHDC
jgi:hypothetical protein